MMPDVVLIMVSIMAGGRPAGGGGVVPRAADARGQQTARGSSSVHAVVEPPAGSVLVALLLPLREQVFRHDDIGEKLFRLAAVLRW